jgi:hypothetical protein
LHVDGHAIHPSGTQPFENWYWMAAGLSAHVSEASQVDIGVLQATNAAGSVVSQRRAA